MSNIPPETIKTQPITPELVLNKPDTYSQRLIELLDYTQSGSAVWNFLKNKNLIDPQLVINPHWDRAQTKGKIIVIGALPINEQRIQQKFFKPDLFQDYTTQTVYKFIHEMSHKLTPLLLEQDDSIKAIVQKIRYDRTKGVEGYTPKGNSTTLELGDNDRDQFQATTEDIVELVTMYIWNPKFLKSHLDSRAQSLSIEKLHSTREPKLVHLSEQTAQMVYKSIDASIRKVIQQPTG